MLVSCPVDNRPEDATRLWGKLKIKVKSDSLAFSIYRKLEVEETFNCSYELNPDYRETIETNDMMISGVSEDGGARIIELHNHRFFIATGFLPQISSEETRPHPIIVAYLEAALYYKKNRMAGEEKSKRD